VNNKEIIVHVSGSNDFTLLTLNHAEYYLGCITSEIGGLLEIVAR
jgi:hypothetical protein